MNKRTHIVMEKHIFFCRLLKVGVLFFILLTTTNYFDIVVLL